MNRAATLRRRRAVIARGRRVALGLAALYVVLTLLLFAVL